MKPYLVLTVFIFLLLCLPQSKMDGLRASLIGNVIPTMGKGSQADEVSSLQIENGRLKEQLKRVEEWLQEDGRLKKEIQKLCQYTTKGEEDPFYQRRGIYLKQNIEHQIQSLPAKVIYRTPSLWNSSFWVNVGEKDNELLGKKIIAKNSPVVIGNAIVGVVESVQQNKSLVRLITDELLTPSVRVLRGGDQNRLLHEKISQTIDLIKGRDDLPNSLELAKVLTAYKSQIDLEEAPRLLAKGELHGSSAPSGRTLSNKLKGEGFNYDYPDAEGDAKNLRTGSGEPLIKVGDLLVTTGMDGIFPPDFLVAVVTKIFPLHEGGCSYSLEAESIIQNFETINEVFILPPFFLTSSND